MTAGVWEDPDDYWLNNQHHTIEQIAEHHTHHEDPLNLINWATFWAYSGQ